MCSQRAFLIHIFSPHIILAKCSPSMFIEWMNTLSAVLVPQLYSLIITGWHNQTIIWRKPARDILAIYWEFEKVCVCVCMCLYMCAYLAQRTQLICWLREKRNFCLWTVHTLMVLSSEAVTRVCPSPEKLTLRTEAVCALKNVDSAFLYTYTNTETTLKINTSYKKNPVDVQKCVSSSELTVIEY